MSKTKCYSVRLEALTSISEKAYRATAYDGSTAIIPKSQVFGQDSEHTVQVSMKIVSILALPVMAGWRI